MMKEESRFLKRHQSMSDNICYVTFVLWAIILSDVNRNTQLLPIYPEGSKDIRPTGEIR